MTYDLFIIGGGVNGCGIARDASGRGLKVFLAEQGGKEVSAPKRYGNAKYKPVEAAPGRRSGESR